MCERLYKYLKETILCVLRASVDTENHVEKQILVSRISVLVPVKREIVEKCRIFHDHDSEIPFLRSVAQVNQTEDNNLFHFSRIPVHTHLTSRPQNQQQHLIPLSITSSTSR